MAIPAFISAGVTLLSSAQSLLGGKDGERQAANKAAYQAAIAGDDNALLFLKQRTGSYGVALVPGYGEIGGWATDAAKRDAQTMYDAAIKYRQVGEVVAGIGDTVQGVAQKAGVTIIPGTKQEISIQLVVIVLAAFAVAWFVFRKKR